jgi:hypothetical protein
MGGYLYRFFTKVSNLFTQNLHVLVKKVHFESVTDRLNQKNDSDPPKPGDDPDEGSGGGKSSSDQSSISITV